jgi:hypothetical protein
MTSYRAKTWEKQELKRKPSLITGIGLYEVTPGGIKKIYSDQFIKEFSPNFNRGEELDTGILSVFGDSPIGKEYIRVHHNKIEVLKFDTDEYGNVKPEIIEDRQEVTNYLNSLKIALPAQYDQLCLTDPKLRFELSEELERRRYNSFI